MSELADSTEAVVKALYAFDTQGGDWHFCEDKELYRLRATHSVQAYTFHRQSQGYVEVKRKALDDLISTVETSWEAINPDGETTTPEQRRDVQLQAIYTASGIRTSLDLGERNAITPIALDALLAHFDEHEPAVSDAIRNGLSQWRKFDKDDETTWPDEPDNDYWVYLPNANSYPGKPATVSQEYWVGVETAADLANVRSGRWWPNISHWMPIVEPVPPSEGQ